jgi:magnesium-transporting ATPase (P-type)
VRNNEDWEVESRDLVPGDIVLLESGARVPADLRPLRVESDDDSVLSVKRAREEGASAWQRRDHFEKHPHGPDAGMLKRCCNGSMALDDALA